MGTEYDGAVQAGQSDEEMTTAEYFGETASFFRLLGSMVYRELSEEQIEALASCNLEYPDDGSDMAEGLKGMRAYLARRGSNARQDLAVEYARVFLAAGVYEGETAVPYESVYTSEEGILMQDARDSVVRIYCENGLEVDPDLNVPEDHLGFELEFMGHMSQRIAEKLRQGESAEDDMRTQLAFIDEHLLNWIPDLQKRVDDYAQLRFYPSVLKVAVAYLREHRAAILEVLE